MNLYGVFDSNYDWCCYVFENTRNKAKLRVATEVGQDYTDMRCKTVRKGVNFPYPKTVFDENSEGYDIVLECGVRYLTEEEMCY